MQGKRLNKHLLHIYLWRRTDSFDQIEVHQRKLAATMGVGHESICRIFKRMVNEGRIKRVKSAQYRVNTYLIIEPDLWKERDKIKKLHSSSSS